MTQTFKAMLATDNDGKVQGGFTRLRLSDLPDEEVLVKVAYSSLNYKDGLAITGAARICRKLPMVCGIDLAGTVVESRHDSYRPGDPVVITGCGLSESYWGGFSEFQRVKAEWLVPLPDNLSLEQAMAVGTAGVTAMLSVQALRDGGIEPGAGPIAVTGASGGVGSFTVMLLNTLGYQVTAFTGRADESAAYLTALGASQIAHRDQLARKPGPLEKELWAGAVDAVGGDTLATLLAQTRREGIVTACGLAGSSDLSTTVMPFILRGVTLRGIDSVTQSRDCRRRVWDDLATLLDGPTLARLYRVEPFDKLPELARDILAGAIRGRVVIAIGD
ncbi:MAG: MDR family oxidoreductase [Porticoccaceae bacterium]